MHGKIFATVTAILALCLLCTGCFDSDEQNGDRRTQTKTEAPANVVPNDECAQILALYLDQQLLFKNEPTKNAPAYFIEHEDVLNPQKGNLFLNVAGKDCLTSSLCDIELLSSLGHNRYLTYEQIEQIAEKFADLQERCSYEIEDAGAPPFPTGEFPKYLRGVKVYNVTITAPDMAEIEASIFKGVKSEYLSKLPAADKTVDFKNYHDMIIFNERDLVWCGDPEVSNSYAPNMPNHHESSIKSQGYENPQEHSQILWVHYAVDRDVVGKIIFDQFMNTLEKPDKLPTRTIKFQVLLAPYQDERIPKVCSVVDAKNFGFKNPLPDLTNYVWQGFGETFVDTTPKIIWNRPQIETSDGKALEKIFYTGLGMYVSKNGEDAPPCKDVVVADGNKKFRGVELENVSVAVCDIKESSTSFGTPDEDDHPTYEQKSFYVTLLIDNASDEDFVPLWIRIIDEYGDEIRSISPLTYVKPHSKEKVLVNCETGLFFTNKMSHLYSGRNLNFIANGWQKYTAGYDPKTETLILDANSFNKKFADLKKWQEANDLHAYEMPQNYFVKYGRLLIPMKVSTAD